MLHPNHVFVGACAALYAFAFIAAPRSCEWGLQAYVWAGVVLAPGLAVLALVFRAGVSWPKALLHSVLYAAGAACTWIAGLFMADMRIICKLF